LSQETYRNLKKRKVVGAEDNKGNMYVA